MVLACSVAALRIWFTLAAAKALACWNLVTASSRAEGQEQEVSFAATVV